MRDNHGRFVKGSSGGPGRPARATERRYLAALSEAVSLKDWREVVTRAVGDAKSGDAKAREWLAKYLIGEPKGGDGADAEPVSQPDINGERLELIGQYLRPLNLTDERHPVEEHARIAATRLLSLLAESQRRQRCVDTAAG